jgi:glyoxylase-like metal-dependent hydrolase (beta-lactamase superfamily II)
MEGRYHFQQKPTPPASVHTSGSKATRERGPGLAHSQAITGSLNVIFRETGEVKDSFYVLGSVHNPIYLLKSCRPVLFDAGLAPLGPAYEQAIRAVLRATPPEMILLTHVHFDHCGAVSYLKRAFPGLKVAASKKAGDIMKRPNAVRLMRHLSEKAVAAIEDYEEVPPLPTPFEPFEPDLILKEGDVIELETGLHIEVIATPGHTWDFLSYYVPEKRILVASEAAGCAVNSEHISIDCLTDFDTYRHSLKRLAALDADILCQGHRFVYEGEDVSRFLEKSMAAALQFKAMVEDLWRTEKGDVRRVMMRIKKREYDPLPLPKQPEPAYLANLEARVKGVLRAKAGDGSGPSQETNTGRRTREVQEER